MKSPSAGFRHLFILFLIIVLIPVTGCGDQSSSASRNLDTLIASVNGTSLELGEFQLYADKFRSGAIKHFSEKYNAQYGKDFWITRYGEEGTPLEYLKQVALKEATSAKIIQGLGEEKNLIGNMDYSSFSDNFRKENVRRAEAVKNKEPVYGPVQYEEAAYYAYRMSNLKLQIIQLLSDEATWSPSDEEIQTYYLANAFMFHQPDMFKLNKITIPLDNRQEAFKKAQIAKEEIRKGKSFEMVAQEFNVSGEAETSSFNPRKIMEPGIDDEGLLKLLQGLGAGEVSDIWEEHDSLQIIQLAERVDGGDKPLEEVRDSVKTAIIEQKLNQWVSDKTKAAKVELTSSYYQFTF